MQLVSLTAAGRRPDPELAKLEDRNDDKFFAWLEPADRDTLRALLIQLAEHHQSRDVPTE